MPLSFRNLERLRVLSACTVLVLAAVTVSSILSTITLMKPIRILMDSVPVTAEYHPAKFVVSYKTMALDGSLETVSQDSVHRKHRNLLQPSQQQGGGGGGGEMMQMFDEASHALEELVTSVDELLYQQSLQTNMLEADEEWAVDDDEDLFFYPKGFFDSSEKMAIQRKLRGAEPTIGESVYQQSLETTMLEADKERMVDDDEDLFFYPKGFFESSKAMTIQRKLRGTEPTVAKRNTQEASETSATTEVLPVVMVGVASAVIACAVMLYLTDMRDRCRHRRFLDDGAETTSRKQIHLSLRRTGTSASSNMSERWVEGVGQRDGVLHPMMLPPFLPDADDLEDMGMVIACVPPKQISLYRESTSMTSILMDGDVWEGRIVPYDNSQAAGGSVSEQDSVTGLPGTNRVGDRTNIGNLVQSPGKQERKIAVMSSSPVRSESSRCSTLTDISEGTESTPQLVGETVLKDEEATLKKINIVPSMSLEFSDDTPSDEERDAVDGSHLAHCDVRESPTQQTQLEHLTASISVTDPAGRHPFSSVHDMQAVPIQDYIRDIYFVVGTTPSAQNGVDFGLDLLDATCPVTHPSVTAVHAKSPLLGRIFTGDFVLHVNDTDVAGQSAVHVAKLMECNNGDTQDDVTGAKTKTVIKLTIMSSHVDGMSDTDGASDADGQASLDFGFPDSAVEV